MLGQYEIGSTFNDLTPAGLAAAVKQLFSGSDHGDIAEQIRAARSQYSWSAAAEATLAGYGMADSLVGVGK